MLTKRACYDSVSPWIVKSNGVNHITVSFKTNKLLTSFCAPYLTRSIIATSDEFVTLLVEGTICKRQDMCPQNLKQEVIFPSIVIKLLDKLCL